MTRRKGLDILVFSLLLFLVFDTLPLDGTEVSAALKAEGSDQPLDLGTVKAM